MATEIEKVKEELEEDWMADNAVMVGIMALISAVVTISMLSRFTWSVPVLSASEVAAAGYEPVAGRVGLMWHQLNPAGRPNELRMIAENSTGAFERMLLGLTT